MEEPRPEPGAEGGDKCEPRGVIPVAPENVAPYIRDVGSQRGEERGRGARGEHQNIERDFSNQPTNLTGGLLPGSVARKKCWLDILSWGPPPHLGL